MRVVTVLNEPVSRYMLLLLFLLLFSWPYLSFIEQTAPGRFFGYFFITWLALIVILLVSNSEKDNNGDKKK